MPKFQEILHVWKTVFKNWKYSFLGIIIALLFYVLNVLLNNIKNIKSVYSNFEFSEFLNFIFILIINFGENIERVAFVNMIVISVLFGFLISLLVFKINTKTKGNQKSGAIGFAGAFIGVLFSGCAACGVGLVSALGLGAGFLAIFPYEGIELSFLSIIILIITIIKISKDLTMCDVCRINLKIDEMKGGKK